MLKKQYVSKRILPIIVAFALAFGCMISIQLTDSYADESNYPTTVLNVIGATENVDWLVLKTEPFNTDGIPAEAVFENYTLGTPIERTWKNVDGLVPWFSTNKADLHEKCGIFTGISLSNDNGVTISAFYASDITKGLEKDELEFYDYSSSLTTDGKPGADNPNHEIYWYSGLYYDPDADDYNFYQSRSHKPAKPWVEVFFADDYGLKREAVTTDNHIITLYFNGEERDLDLDQSDMELEAGNTSTRVAKTQSSYYGDATVSYSSADENVATVNAETGEVSAIAAGDTVITASIKDGDKKTSKSYNVIVTGSVSDPAVDAVVEKINAIGEVTLEKENAIVEARAAFNALTDEQKAHVPDEVKTTLENAEKELLILKISKIEADITALKGEGETNATIVSLETELNELKAVVNDAATQTDLLALQDRVTALEGAVVKQAVFEEAVGLLNGMIEDLQDEIAALKGEDGTEATIASLESKLTDLDSALKVLEGSAVTETKLNEKIQTLNNTISGLTNEINELKRNSALDNLKANAAEEISSYMEEKKADILPEDLLEIEVVTLKSILKANNAKDEVGINEAIKDAKEAIDEKVQIKKDTEAAKKLKVTGLKLKSKSKKITVTWKKNTGADGYQVQYKLKSAKKYQTLKTLTGTKAMSKKLKKGKKYQFRVRTYKNVNGAKIFGIWTTVKTCKCK